MATMSRSALSFLRRHGMTEDRLPPNPRLDAASLLVHTVPLRSPPLPDPAVLQGFEGNPPPDRNVSRPWPGQASRETTP
jgi:hypothetical protein